MCSNVFSNNRLRCRKFQFATFFPAAAGGISCCCLQRVCRLQSSAAKLLYFLIASNFRFGIVQESYTMPNRKGIFSAFSARRQLFGIDDSALFALHYTGVCIHTALVLEAHTFLESRSGVS